MLANLTSTFLYLTVFFWTQPQQAQFSYLPYSRGKSLLLPELCPCGTMWLLVNFSLRFKHRLCKGRQFAQRNLELVGFLTERFCWFLWNVPRVVHWNPKREEVSLDKSTHSRWWWRGLLAFYCTSWQTTDLESKVKSVFQVPILLKRLWALIPKSDLTMSASCPIRSAEPIP